MANADARGGLVPVQRMDGSPWQGGLKRFYLPTGENNALYIGDPVDLGGAGINGVPSIVKATLAAGNYFLGAIVGFEIDPSYLNQKHRTASTARYAYVCLANNMIFSIRGCSSAVIPEASVGLNAIMVETHTGSTVTGLSGIELDSGVGTAPSANATYGLTILGLAQEPNNDITAVNAKWLVSVNMPRLAPAVVGVA